MKVSLKTIKPIGIKSRSARPIGQSRRRMYEDECRDSYEADVDNYGRSIVPVSESVIEERAYEVQHSGRPYQYGLPLEEYEYDARDDDANYEDLEDIYSYYRERGSYTGRHESTAAIPIREHRSDGAW